MKKTIPLLMSAILILMLVAAPLAAASSMTGTGQNRTVTLNDPFINTNVTVVVPSSLDNSSANSFAFLVIDESSTSVDYTFNVTIWDNNVTWYNGTVDVTSVADDNVTGYVNFTALALAPVADANITITMLFTGNWTEADVWYGTVNVLSESDYMLGVYLMQALISLLSTVVIVMVIAKLVSGFGKEAKKTGKKK